MDLVTEVYRATAFLPESEKFGLRSQMRRAAVSVPSNIAEGAVGRSDQHFIKFLTYAIGSLAELETQFEIAIRLNFLTEKDCQEINESLVKCKQITHGLKKSILKRNS